MGSTSDRDKGARAPLPTDSPGRALQGPTLSARGEARRRGREARQAKALRANLRRRKADLDSRSAPAAEPASEDEDR